MFQGHDGSWKSKDQENKGHNEQGDLFFLVGRPSQLGVSKNRATPKGMGYNGKPY